MTSAMQTGPSPRGGAFVIPANIDFVHFSTHNGPAASLWFKTAELFVPSMQPSPISAADAVMKLLPAAQRTAGLRVFMTVTPVGTTQNPFDDNAEFPCMVVDET